MLSVAAEACSHSTTSAAVQRIQMKLQQHCTPGNTVQFLSLAHHVLRADDVLWKMSCTAKASLFIRKQAVDEPDQLLCHLVILDFAMLMAGLALECVYSLLPW